MPNTTTFAGHDCELINRALEQIGANCGLSWDDIQCIILANGEISDNAELQFIELNEHLTALVGNSPAVQSDWLGTMNLDLGETPLSLIKAPGGVEHLRDYLAGQRHRC
jgi:Protein of unknown function (DUF2384)